MSSTLPIPCIDSNPDVAGIGVRSSVYIQAVLNIICMLIFACDGVIRDDEVEAMSRDSATLFTTGSAILLSSFIEAATHGMSAYHALITLNINLIYASSGLTTIVVLAYGVRAQDEGAKKKSERLQVALFSAMTIHSIAVGAFGIMTWRDIENFGNQSECTSLIIFPVLFRKISVINRKLKRASLVIYSFFEIPLLNIVIPSLPTILLCAYSYMILELVTNGIVNIRTTTPRGVLGILPSRRTSWKTTALILTVTSGAVTATLIIASTEYMISLNKPWVKEGELEWSFGQTLAMVLTLGPLYSTISVGYRGIKDLFSVNPNRPIQNVEPQQTGGPQDSSEIPGQEVLETKPEEILIDRYKP